MNGDMYGDFSRLTFVPENHFSAVLVQQGRVLTDADANEQTAILLHTLRRLTADVLGPYAGPAGGHANFEITLDNWIPGRPVLGIAKGRYYVHGVLCEADVAVTYYDQPHAFRDPELVGDRLPDPPYLVYLRVWERQITAVEDPSISEPALGADGFESTRSKVVWQVIATDEFPPGSGEKIAAWPNVDPSTARKRWNQWEDRVAAKPRPTMKARARQLDPTGTEPCVVSPTARYQGLENQLYRVEVHTGGTAANAVPGGSATFKWSRINGAATLPIESVSGLEVTIASFGSDARLSLAVNDWVEVLDDRSLLRGERQPLLRVIRVEPHDRLVALDTALPANVGRNPALHPVLRRWDQQENLANAGFATLDPAKGVLELQETTDGEDGWLELENGVQVQFQAGGQYTAGDYWLIPARTSSEDVEWPQEAGGPQARPPLGIEYGFAPLALVDASATLHDTRSLFGPISKVRP
jgi:hypothetical protein